MWLAPHLERGIGYAHMQNGSLNTKALPGMTVKAGDVLGLAGNAGNAHANAPAKLDLQYRRIRPRSLARLRRDHDLGKSRRSRPQLIPPSINLPRNHIPAPRHLANRSPWRKCLRDHRSLLFRAPPPTTLRSRQHLNPAHRTVPCTGASHTVLAPRQKTALKPARARRSLSDGYTPQARPIIAHCIRSHCHHPHR
jgi:hypothetical protein